MEPWLQPLYDAEGMRAVDRWAIEEQGVPSPQLMEAAGTALAEAVAGLAPAGPRAGPLRQGQQRRRRLRSPRAGLREMGFEVETALRDLRASGLPADLDRLAGRARARSSTRSSAPASPARRANRPRRRSRRSTAAGRRSSPATSPPASTPPAARSPAPRSRPTSPSASTPPSSGSGSRPASGTTGELRVAPIGIPAGAPAEPARPGRSSPPCSPWLPRRGAALDQVQLRPGDDRRRLARPDRGGADVLAGGDPGRRRLRDRRRPRRPRAGLRSRPSPR